MVDETRLHQFIGQMLGDLGGAASIAMVRIGDALGLYRLLNDKGAMTCAELAREAGVNERYLREWLSHQAASNYLSYDPSSSKFALPPEQAMVFAIEDSPVYMLGGFDLMATLLDAQPKVQEAFKTGGGVAWSDHTGCMFCAVARFFRPGYHNNLVAQWLPALDGVVEKLQRGAEVADVGCGHGWSTVLMAKAFPQSRFMGYDFHPSSIENARAHAREHGEPPTPASRSARRRNFRAAISISSLSSTACTTWAILRAPRRTSSQSLKADGTWMIVEPMAGDRLEDNLNPVGRLYYAGSTMICVPTSLSQEVGAALGAQAGEARLREVITPAGSVACAAPRRRLST